MPTSLKKPIKFEFTKKGVLIAGKGDPVAPSIRFKSVATNSDGACFAVLSFRDHDGLRHKKSYPMAMFNPRNIGRLADDLTDAGWWPLNRENARNIIKALGENPPQHRCKLVGAPGWHGRIYVTPTRNYGPAEEKEDYLLDDNTGADLAPFLVSGSLKAWQQKVGKVARCSSRLRLGIGAALAAPLLQPLMMNSFAINLCGGTSGGKTTANVVAASVWGTIGPGLKLPSWADSRPAFEQLCAGYRDAFVPLDEAADGEEDEPDLRKRAKALAFAIGRNGPRNLNKAYLKANKLSTRDYRNVVFSTSEHPLSGLARDQNKPRSGEEARLIDVAAFEAFGEGIFDGKLSIKRNQTASQFANQLVNQIRVDAFDNQGSVGHAFLSRFTKDKSGIRKVKRAIREFEEKPRVEIRDRFDRRVMRNFALIFAASSLAIEYQIIPWNGRATRKAIDKCLASALGTFHNASTSTITTHSAVNQLTDLLSKLTIAAVDATGVADEKARQDAKSLAILTP